MIELVTIKGGKASGQGGGPDGQDAGANLYIVDASPIFSATIIQQGSGAIYGGAGYLINSSARFITSTVEDNTATAGAGFFLRDSTASFEDNLFNRNGASKDGGAFFLSNSAAQISGNEFNENVAGTAGGALFLDGSAATVTNNHFAKNKAGSAGAIYLDFSPAQITGNRIAENTAESAGGVMIANSDALFDGNTLFKNTALNGGGVYVEASAPQIVNNMVISNSITSSGAAIYVLSGSPHIVHNTILHNNGGDGSAISIAAVGGIPSVVTLLNNIIAHHELGIFVQADSSATANGTLWFANKRDYGTAPENPNGFSEGTLRITSDPLFVDAAKLNFRLLNGSPAIEAALPSSATGDFEGHPRPTDRAADIGADEYYYPAMEISSLTAPEPLLAGLDGLFTFHVVNTGNVPLQAIITGTIPAAVSPAHVQTWAVTIPVGQVWSESIQRVIPFSYSDDIEYILHVVAQEGPQETIAKTVKVTPPDKRAEVQLTRQTEKVVIDQPVLYAFEVKNTGNQPLSLVITATLPPQAESGGAVVWEEVVSPGGAWANTMVLTPTTTVPSKEMTLKLDVVSSDGAVVVMKENTATISQPVLTVEQSIEPDPPTMGQPFTLTVTLANTGDVAMQASITVTLDPPFVQDSTFASQILGPGQTITQLVPVDASSYLGMLESRVDVVTDVGIKMTDTISRTIDIAALDATIVAVKNGNWNDPDTWEPARVPRADDRVRIAEGITVQVVAPVTVKSLEVRGTLLGPPDSPLIVEAIQEIQNFGLIQAANGVDGAPGTPGQEVELQTQTVHNEGLIRAGDGGHSAPGRGGAGGSVTIEADLLSNMGNIEAGSGGDGDDGGNGGILDLKITSPKGEVISEGNLKGGSGGAGNPGNGGHGGSVTVTGPGGQTPPTGDGGGDVIIIGSATGGDGGAGNDGGDGGSIRIDVGVVAEDGDGSGGTVVVDAGAVIRGGRGGDATGSGSGGNGGDVQVAAREMGNYGESAAGDGGDAAGNGAAAGKGGDLYIVAGQGGDGIVDNTGGEEGNGVLKAGNGGSGNPTATTSQNGGDGGSVTVVSSPAVYIEDGTVAGGIGGDGVAGGDDGFDGNVVIVGGDGNSGDEPFIFIFGEETQISGQDVTIFGGDAFELLLVDLGSGAVRIQGTFRLAVGKGGAIDLTGNQEQAFIVDGGGEFLLYVDGNGLLLDAEVPLSTLANVTPVVSGSRILYAVHLLAPRVLFARPGAQVIIPVLVTNLSPVEDAYQLGSEVRINSLREDLGQPWTAADLPTTLLVAGSSASRTAITVTVPLTAALGSDQFVRFRAFSYSDGTAESEGLTQVIVSRQGLPPVFLPLVTRSSALNSPAWAPGSELFLFLPMIGDSEVAVQTQDQQPFPEETIFLPDIRQP
jgi:hypothetical protein